MASVESCDGSRRWTGSGSLVGLVLFALLFTALPSAAATAGGEGGHSATVLFVVAVLVLVAKAGGLAALRLGAPAVLGELLAGVCLANVPPLLLGGAGIGFARSDPALQVLAEIGVLILLFDVGLEADLRHMIRVGWAALLVALTGVAAPMLLGFLAAAWLLPDAPTMVHVFVGATLSATSVGITARVLKDLDAIHSREGRIILGAAVVDDILGLVILAVVSAATATAGEGVSGGMIAGLLLRATVFLAATIGLGMFLSGPIARLAAATRQPRMIVVFGLALCFALAFAAEQIGLAGVIGAFAAGLMLDPYGEGVPSQEGDVTLKELMEPLGDLFVPLFFVLMGVQVDLSSLADPSALALGAVLIVVGIAGKLVCGAAAVGRGLRRLAIGFGMVPRGEVGLIFAGIGATLTVAGEPLLSKGMFTAIVLMVLVTTLVAPIGLRRTLAR
jgi:Kef-type K+ transport system membrane component KefB